MYLIWNKQTDGRWFLTLFVETGRVKDAEGRQLKTALRKIAEKFTNIEFRLTTNQNVILTNVSETERSRHQFIAGANTALRPKSKPACCMRRRWRARRCRPAAWRSLNPNACCPA